MFLFVGCCVIFLQKKPERWSNISNRINKNATTTIQPIVEHDNLFHVFVNIWKHKLCFSFWKFQNMFRIDQSVTVDAPGIPELSWFFIVIWVFIFIYNLIYLMLVLVSIGCCFSICESEYFGNEIWKKARHPCFQSSLMFPIEKTHFGAGLFFQSIFDTCIGPCGCLRYATPAARAPNRCGPGDYRLLCTTMLAAWGNYARPRR